ncbi:hypothetical protein D3C72_1960370 [compost metagenome]
MRRTYFNLVVLLACLGQLGRTEDARKLIDEAVANAPLDLPRYWQIFTAYVDPADYAHFTDGLRKAGLPAVP